MSSSNNKTIAKNSLILYADLIISSVLWLIASRILLAELGASDYGLYNVVGGIVLLLNIVNTAMISTTYRYIAYEMGKGKNNINKIFNASFKIHVLIALSIVVVGLPIGIYYIDSYLNTEGSNISDAYFVYYISIVTCVINTATVPFLGLNTALERFSVKAIINISKQLLTLILITFLMFIPENKLKYYALFALIPVVFQALTYVYYSYKYDRSTIRYVRVGDKNLYLEMISFTFWIFLGALARIGKTQGASLLVNFFFGTLLNAAFGIANTVNGFVGIAAGSLTQAAVPQITKSFSGGDQQRSMNLVVYISKYSYILMLLVCVPFIMQTEWILNFWLTDVPDYTSVFVQLILIDALITCLGAGIPSLYQATGQIRIFQISMSFILLSSIGIGFLGYYLGFPPYSILVVYCILSLIDRVVALLLIKYSLKMDIKPLLTFSYVNSLKLTLLVMPFYWLNKYANSNITCFLSMIGTEISLIIIIYFWGLTNDEKSIISTFVKNKISKRKINVPY